MIGLAYVREQWAAGEHHGFPRCCRARFILGNYLPGVPGELGARLRRVFSPRYAIADGLVPCEWHALRFLVTGDKSGWRKPLPAHMCCEMRADVVECGAAHMERLVDVDGCSIWMFGPDADNAIGITHCPFCGAELAHAGPARVIPGRFTDEDDGLNDDVSAAGAP